MFDQSCAQMLPEQVRRNRPVRRHDVAVLLAQLHPHVGVQLQVERPHLLPQPIELLRERRPAACRTSPATSRRCRRSPAPWRPCSRARRSARSPSASAARSCASLPTRGAAPARCASRPAPASRRRCCGRLSGLRRIGAPLALAVGRRASATRSGSAPRLPWDRPASPGRATPSAGRAAGAGRRAAPPCRSARPPWRTSRSRRTAACVARASSASVSSVMKFCADPPGLRAGDTELQQGGVDRLQKGLGFVDRRSRRRGTCRQAH